jgi:putative ABC transport system permease protein
MLLLTIKSALRNLLREKQNAFIIILSLTISFAFSNILITFISFEMNTDAFHENKDNIYRMFSDDPFEQGKKIRYIQGDMSDFLHNNYPEVEQVCLVNALEREGNILGFEDIKTSKKLLLAVDSTFFSFFDFQFLEGSKLHAIQKDGIVLKESLAKSLLGDPPYINKTITIFTDQEQKPVKVTGVLKSFYENTQLKFDAIASGQGMFGGSIYLMLNDKADPGELALKLSENKLTPSLIGPGNSTYELEPFTTTYFNPFNVQPYDFHRNKQLVVICWAVVFLLSLTASFNFINLYIVGLLKRQKEIGVKRVFGAGKTNMILSIGMEVGVFVVISIILSLALTYYLLPYVNATLNTNLSFSYFTYVKVFSIVLGAILLLALLITFYLSFFVWRLKPISLIQGKSSGKVKANRLMFTVQFFITVGLVICSFVVINQMRYIKSKPLGFNKHLMQLLVNHDQKEHLAVLKDKLLSYAQIEHVSMSSGNPISGNAIVRFDLEDGEFYSPFLIAGDGDFIETMGLEIIEGSNINPQNEKGMLVNETFVRYFDMEFPIGQPIPGSDLHIVGVVRDFNCRSLKQEIPPFIIGYDKNLRFLLIDISNAEKEEIISLVSKEWTNVFPDEIFEYKLVEDELLAHHQEDALFFQMIMSFTLASLIISCFGLFGIASFTTARRSKEIGIRKALGASFRNIIFLVWRDYVKLIALSFIFAVPVVNYFLTDWLQEFAYRIELSWWLYLIPGVVILLIALLTISGQSIKAASLNPADSIRDE